MTFKMIALFLIVFAVSASSAQSQLQLSYNFGQVKEGDIVSHTFKILNSSPFMWKIKSIMPSCGCVSAKLIGEKEGIDRNFNPGEAFKIEVKIDTADYEGAMEQFVYVYIRQESESKILKLVTEGEIIQDEK